MELVPSSVNLFKNKTLVGFIGKQSAKMSGKCERESLVLSECIRIIFPGYDDIFKNIPGGKKSTRENHVNDPNQKCLYMLFHLFKDEYSTL